MTTESADHARLETEAAQVAAAKHDPTAFAPLYEAYVDAIYRYAYRRVGSRPEAEDVTAQTFQQALAALPNFEWRGVPFGAWLYRIAANIIARSGRGTAREVAVEDVTIYAEAEGGGGDAAEDPAARVEQQAASGELLAAIRRLPLDQQRALVMRFSWGLSAREIGEQLGRSEGAAKQLVLRALRALRADPELEEGRGV